MDLTTIDELIEMLQKQKKKHGGTSCVCIEGFDECPARAEDIPEGESVDEYPNCQTWLVT